MSDDLKINQILGNGIEYILQKNDHQKVNYQSFFSD
jgi:hypothetical protein